MNEIFFTLVSGIFGTVAKIYDIILEIASNRLTKSSVGIEDFATTIYVLAGVFMLFRVCISMIQMLLNPDLISDKQVGAGKLMTRIIISLVLLLAFVPNGILLNDSSDEKKAGLFPRIERAILGEKGLINSILVNEDSILGNPFNFSKNTNIKSKSCYYYGYENKKSEVYKVIFYNGNPKKSNAKEVVGSNGVYYLVVSGYVGGKDSGKDVTYSSIDGTIKYGNGLVTDKGNLECPKALNKNDNGEYVTSNRISSYSGIFGGWTSVNGMIKGIEEIADNKTTGIERFFSGFVGGFISGIIKFLPDGLEGISQFSIKLAAKEAIKNNVDIELLTNLKNREAALSFSQKVATAFQECTSGNEKECQDAQSRMFGTSGGDNDIVDLANDGKMKIDYFMSIVFGIALIVYLVFLAVDIIIRKFKLLLLEFLAPIPIISYVDPKDKIFNQWIKMYFSTFVDIFIKLFAIKVALILLNANIIPDYNNLIITILYIMAILIFAKVIPSMISKIFGLESMGGSFKEIGNMLKSGAGFAAGAAIGAGAGLITGGAAFAATKGQGLKNRFLAGAQGLGSGLSGAVKGAGSGSKGNILGGAKNVVAANSNRRGQYNSGLTPIDLLTAATVGKAGMGYAQQVDRQLERKKQESERLGDVNKVKSEISSIASGSDFGTFVDNLAKNDKLDPNQAKKWKDKWIDAQIDADRGDTASVQNFAQSLLNDDLMKQYSAFYDAEGNLMDASTIASSGAIIEKGKQAQIRQQLTELNNMISGDSTIANVVGTNQITSYAKNGGVKDADSAVNKRKEEIFNEISKATQTTEYRTSKAAIDATSSGTNKK